MVRQDCKEMSWIEVVAYLLSLGGYTSASIEDLLNRTQPNVLNYKAKVDYVQKPIPLYGLKDTLNFFFLNQNLR